MAEGIICHYTWQWKCMTLLGRYSWSTHTGWDGWTGHIILQKWQIVMLYGAALPTP